MMLQSPAPALAQQKVKAPQPVLALLLARASALRPALVQLQLSA
jgi:hypothetical protein